MRNLNAYRIYCNRRVMSVLGLGFASGLPLALTSSTLQAWMVTEHIDLRIIGIFSLIGLPYTLKMLWSPFLDRFSLPFLGRRRGWILVSQFLLALCLYGLSRSSPSTMPFQVAMIALLIAFFSASQDIVIDAYRTDVLRPIELGAGAATAVLGYRLAMLTSGALALILSDLIPWSSVFLIMALLMLTMIPITIISPEPEVVCTAPKTMMAAIRDPLVSYFHRPGAIGILLFIILFKLGDVIAAAMMTPFLLDIGFSRTDVGTVNKAFGLAGTIIGSLAGGVVIARIGLNRSLWIFAGLQAVSNLSFTVLAIVGQSFTMLVIAVGIENLCGGMGTAGFVAFMMSLCDKRFTATQYALLTSLMGLTRVLAGVTTGFLAVALGWPLYFSISVLGAVPAVVLLPRFAPWNRQQNNEGDDS